MRERLLECIRYLCKLYPPLRPCITYSQVLSQSEVNVFVAFAKKRVECLLQEYPVDGEAQDRALHSLFQGSTGLSTIKEKDVIYVESLLARASSRDTMMSVSDRDLVDFLHEHRMLWWQLHKAYEKIVKNNLVNTCPIVVARPGLVDRIIPFCTRLQKFQEFHKLFHASIHHVLDQNKIRFNDPALNEGLVVYLHEKVFGKQVLLHYDKNKGYAKSAKLRGVLDRYPRTAIIPLLKNMIKAQ